MSSLPNRLAGQTPEEKGAAFYAEKDRHYQELLGQDKAALAKEERQTDAFFRAVAMPDWVFAAGRDASPKSRDPRVRICHDLLDLDDKVAQCADMIQRFSRTAGETQANGDEYHLPVLRLLSFVRHHLHAVANMLGSDPGKASGILQEARVDVRAAVKTVGFMQEAFSLFNLDALRVPVAGALSPSPGIVPVKHLPQAYFRGAFNQRLLEKMAPWEFAIEKLLPSMAGLSAEPPKHARIGQDFPLRRSQAEDARKGPILLSVSSPRLSDAARSRQQAFYADCVTLAADLGAAPALKGGTYLKMLFAPFSEQSDVPLEKRLMDALRSVAASLENVVIPEELRGRLKALIQSGQAGLLADETIPGAPASPGTPVGGRVGNAPRKPSHASLSPVPGLRMGRTAEEHARPGKALAGTATGLTTRKRRASSQPAMPVFRQVRFDLDNAASDKAQPVAPNNHGRKLIEKSNRKLQLRSPIRPVPPPSAAPSVRNARKPAVSFSETESGSSSSIVGSVESSSES